MSAAAGGEKLVYLCFHAQGIEAVRMTMRSFLESMRDLLGAGRRFAGLQPHLDASLLWLCRAQDAAGDGGVARMYHLRTGWGPSYPETTGYIIPTFLHYARLSGRLEFRERALRMAEWECEVQMPEGAVQGGTVDQPPTPAIFNTGQVLFGWCAAHAESGDPRFLDSARRAADYLCSQQDGDGMWRRNLSRYCSARTDTYAYNVRTAWALLVAHEATGEQRYREAAARNVEAVVDLARPNGWLEKNCLTDPDAPLLHTIAYTQQGLLEAGLRLALPRAMETALSGSLALRRTLEEEGHLAGRYDREWRPAVRWRCLTGEAQTAIVWSRLAEWTGDRGWRVAAQRLVEQVCRTQRLRGDPDLAGGVKGSFPVFGRYGQYEYLNWAAKFLADALMRQLGYRAAGTAG